MTNYPRSPYDSASKRSFEYVVRHFTPAWFTVTMGTGAVSLMCRTFPYGTDSAFLRYLTLALFFLDLALFLVFTVISIARYTVFPGVWRRMIQHPTQSLFLGAFPMGAATILAVAASDIHEIYDFGAPFVYTIWVLWWIDVAISLACCWGLFHVMNTRQNHVLESMTLAWVLPAVTLTVACSTGCNIAPAIASYSSTASLVTIFFCGCLMTIGLSIVLMLFAAYFLRAILHGYPPGALVLSCFLPLGPVGQAAYSILLIGSGFRSTFAGVVESLDATALVVEVTCTIFATALWAYATMWLLFAFLGLGHALHQGRITFRLSFWAIVFPNGVYAKITIILGDSLSSEFFKLWGAIYGVGTFLLWLCISLQTIRLLPSGKIFDVPPQEIEIGEGIRHIETESVEPSP